MKEVRRRRELGRPAEAAPGRVELLAQRRERELCRRRTRELSGRRLDLRQVAADRLAQLRALLLDVAAALFPGMDHRAQNGREAGHAAAVDRREVGAGEERQQIGSQEDRVRPAALPVQHLRRQHVDLVEIETLFAVDLDVDERLVHERRDRRIRERLALHDVAPEAGRVADREEDRLVLGLRSCQRLRAPGVPVDRIVGMEQQIRRALGGEAVGALGRITHGIRILPGLQPELRFPRRRHCRASPNPVPRSRWTVARGSSRSVFPGAPRKQRKIQLDKGRWKTRRGLPRATVRRRNHRCRGNARIESHAHRLARPERD